MNKRNYHCLVAGFPDLIPDDRKLHYSSLTMRDYLKDELKPADFELVKLFYLPFDHDNLLNLLYGKEFEWDKRGNFPQEVMERFTDKKQLEPVDSSLFPKYFSKLVTNYLSDQFEMTETEAGKFLMEEWYSLLENSENEFVVQFSEYKKNIANIMLALNGRKHEIPFEEALIGDNEVTRALKRSRLRDFGLTDEIDNIETFVQIFEMENILERELKLDNYTWQFIDEINFFNYFTIEKVLGLVQKVFIAERWYELDKEKGQQIFTHLMEELQSNFEFPEEFSIAYGKRK